MIYIILLIVVIIVTLAIIIVGYRRINVLQKNYSDLCDRCYEMLDKHTKDEDRFRESLDSFANHCVFSVYENVGSHFSVYGSLYDRDKIAYLCPIIVKRFHYDFDNYDEREYAEICANELCDMLNTDYVEHNKR